MDEFLMRGKGGCHRGGLWKRWGGRNFGGICICGIPPFRKRRERMGHPTQSYFRVHFEFLYWLFFDARATNSSNRESKSLRIGDWFDFL